MACPSTWRAGAESAPGRVELADVVRLHGPDLDRRQVLTAVQRRALAAIVACRTPALGGRVETCDRCGASRAVYRSCRDRCCPKCQVVAKEKWVEARCAALLPVQYFHVVFTLPHALDGLARRHGRFALDLLFRSAWATLREFSGDPRHLGAELGVTAVLHTWSQTLAQHVHLHCLVSAGGLAADGASWKPVRNGFLFPVRALSRVFRGKYLAGLLDAARQGRLPGHELPASLRRRLRRHDWVVYCKEPFAGPEHLLAYLGRYTHRIAISNDRIVSLKDGTVTFRWRDRAHGDRQRTMQMTAVEFLRRFVMHVLPRGFQRIRHYGLHANRRRADAVARCRSLLGVAPPPPAAPESAAAAVLRLTGLDLSLCPACGARALRPGRPLPPSRDPPSPPDTS